MGRAPSMGWRRQRLSRRRSCVRTVRALPAGSRTTAVRPSLRAWRRVSFPRCDFASFRVTVPVALAPALSAAVALAKRSVPVTAKALAFLTRTLIGPRALMRLPSKLSVTFVSRANDAGFGLLPAAEDDDVTAGDEPPDAAAPSFAGVSIRGRGGPVDSVSLTLSALADE